MKSHFALNWKSNVIYLLTHSSIEKFSIKCEPIFLKVWLKWLKSIFLYFQSFLSYSEVNKWELIIQITSNKNHWSEENFYIFF